MAQTQMLLLVHATLGLLLVVSAIAKVRRPAHFESVVRAYQLLPPALASSVARVVPVVEVVLGAALATGIAPRTASYLTVALLTVFATAVAINLLRGRRDIDCGCFGTTGTPKLSWWIVGRNVALCLGIWLAIPEAVSPVVTSDRFLAVILGIGGLLTLALALQTARIMRLRY